MTQGRVEDARPGTPCAARHRATLTQVWTLATSGERARAPATAFLSSPEGELGVRSPCGLLTPAAVRVAARPGR